MAPKEETFSHRIKEELALGTYKPKTRKAILSGFIRYVGSVSLSPSFSLRLSSSSASVAKFLFQCLKDVYDVQPQLTYTKQLRLAKNVVYHISVGQKVGYILSDLEISRDFRPVSLRKMIAGDSFQGFMVGTFLASGQVSDPRSGRYFCEIVFNEKKDAEAVLSRFGEFKDENAMGFRMIKRRAKYVLYLKRSDQISVFLNLIGAVAMMFEFENARLERDYFNNENRLTICVQANYSRSLKTGEENIKDILILEEKIGKVYFNTKTQVLADLRKANSDASYQELADLAAKKGLAVTKSGVAHVFGRFAADAAKLRFPKA